MEYTKQGFMAIVTGREIADGQLIILGVGLSMLAGYFAHKNHAPNLMPFTERLLAISLMKLECGSNVTNTSIYTQLRYV